MNFCPNMGINNMNGINASLVNPEMIGVNPGMNMNSNGGLNMNPSNDLFYRLSEVEGRLRRLEQRIVILENEKNNNNSNYVEPDNSLYMI